ncbi:MAG: helix-turn-helix domain-containing protein [Dehalococcoidia bacterium]|nr:helix-turn-helix domain-containing protein [Dehalococcoidia bacterium]
MTGRYRDDPETLTTRWITLGQACKLLGVNESTLRRWADAGHVRSFRTPGGHRRFSEEDLRLLVAGQAPTVREPYNAISNLALTRIRRRLQRGRSQAAHWYSGLGEEERDRMRPLGRRLVALVSEYLTKGTRRTNLLDEAREIAHEYGRLLARDGLSLRDAVEAFIFFRKTLDETAMEEAQKNDLTAEKALELWELLANLADQVLLSIAESYSEAVVATARP